MIIKKTLKLENSNTAEGYKKKYKTTSIGKQIWLNGNRENSMKYE